MSVRVRIKQVRDATKDLNYILGYIEEWKGEEHIKPIGTHQQRYQLIELLTKFALSKLENELQRQGDSSVTISRDNDEDSEDNKEG
jgi:hypothetical protein